MTWHILFETRAGPHSKQPTAANTNIQLDKNRSWQPIRLAPYTLPTPFFSSPHAAGTGRMFMGRMFVGRSEVSK